MRPVYKQLMVNVNVCMSAFYVPRSSLADALAECLHQSRGGLPNRFYGKCRVTMAHLGYRKRCSIKGFGNLSARKTTFDCEELGGRVSVEQYFKKSKCWILRRLNEANNHCVDLQNTTSHYAMPTISPS